MEKPTLTVNAVLGVLLAVLVVLWIWPTGQMMEPLHDKDAVDALQSKLDRVVDATPPEQESTPQEPARKPREKPASKPTVAAAVAAKELDATTDEEWKQFPRNRIQPVSFVSHATTRGEAPVDQMFRNRFLNVMGVYIPRHRRAELKPLLQAVAYQLQQQNKAAYEYHCDQLIKLIAAGKIKPRVNTERELEVVRRSARFQIKRRRALPYSTPELEKIIAWYEDQLANPEKYVNNYSEGKPHVVTKHHSDGVYELDVRRLEGQKAIDEVRRYLETEFLGKTINWFYRQKALPEPARDALLEYAVETDSAKRKQLLLSVRPLGPTSIWSDNYPDA